MSTASAIIQYLHMKNKTKYLHTCLNYRFQIESSPSLQFSLIVLKIKKKVKWKANLCLLWLCNVCFTIRSSNYNGMNMMIGTYQCFLFQNLIYLNIEHVIIQHFKSNKAPAYNNKSILYYVKIRKGVQCYVISHAWN